MPPADRLSLVAASFGIAASLLLAGPPSATAGGHERSRGSAHDPSAQEGLTERERRAVRGAPTSESLLSESPELRELRRFEEGAFPRPGEDALPITRPAEASLPPGLRGPWNGTGDKPLTPPPQGAPGSAAEGAGPDSDFLRGLKLPEIEVRWEPELLRYLDFFKNDPKGRAIMTSWLRRLGRYEATFTRVFEREGLPRDLVYLAMVESGFEPGAVSRVGAGGIWQFMPGSAKAYGLEVSYWFDGRRDPERGAEAAARYLKDLHFRFGSWHLAFAAYNAGYGAVLRSIARYNTNDFWELSRHEAGLPWETCLYVPKILAAAVVGHNREAFGFGAVRPDSSVTYDRVEVAPGTTLATVARAAGVAVEAIQALNPEIVRERTPPDRGPVALRVPPGTAAAYAAAIERSKGPADRIETVVLRFGETLDDVARARGIAPRELRRWNGLRDSAELRGGATVVVPAGAQPIAPRPIEVAGEAAGAATAEDDTILVAVPEREFSYEGRERVFYRTRDADTIEEIATVFGVTADEIVEWNSLDPAAKLHARMVLQLFIDKGFDDRAVVVLDPAKLRIVTLGSEEFLALEAARRGKTRLTYEARPGDTLAKIARRYGLAQGDLARINRLSWNSELEEGQRIFVYSPTPELPRELPVTRGSAGTKRPGRVELAAKNGAARSSATASKPGAPTTKGGRALPSAKSLASTSTRPSGVTAKPGAPKGQTKVVAQATRTGKPAAPGASKPATKALAKP